MKKRIGLATGLLLLAALGVLAFQGYWTYQTYRLATHRLRQDGQAALAATAQQARPGSGRGGCAPTRTGCKTLPTCA